MTPHELDAMIDAAHSLAGLDTRIRAITLSDGDWLRFAAWFDTMRTVGPYHDAGPITTLQYKGINLLPHTLGLSYQPSRQ